MSTSTSSPQPELGGREYLRLIGIAALIGIPAALVAVAFLGLVHVMENLLWTDVPQAMGLGSPPWWMIVGVPAVGGLLVWLARTTLPGDGGHEPVGGISIAPTPISYAPGVALAALASLAFGAVLGPEAPLIALGSVVGMVAVRWWKVHGQVGQVVSTAGAFSAVSALFGGPIVAGVLLLEAGISLGSALVPVLLPGAVAAAVGYTIIVGVGSWSGIPTTGMVVPDLPAYPNTRVVDLLLAVVVGIAVALLVAVSRRTATALLRLRPRVGTGPALVAGGLVVGLLSLLVESRGGSYDDVLFSGQFDLTHLLGMTDGTLLLLVVLAKTAGFMVCLGAGFRGGPVFPAIFIGTAVALVVGSPFGMSTTAALAIGTACGMTAFTRLMFSSLVFALLLGGAASIAAIPAAVLAAAAAWVVGRALDSRAADRPGPGGPDASSPGGAATA